ncbi:MAG TPA: M48 family metalloprotease [Gammaproteobacteria bacterium]|nr:M48 family metalloprotease [Gammaproteobacteria bacterium]
MSRFLAPLLLVAASLTGCAVNPVTGKSELSLLSESDEIDIGTQQYLPMRQAQGGDYVVDPELTRYVNEIGTRLAQASDRPHLPFEFVVLNNSVPNAWALPGGKIAINRGLLIELENEAELAAVLGHEITHATARHGAKAVERNLLLQTGVAVVTLGTALATGREDRAALVGAGAALGAMLVSQKYGRDAELEADYYGMRYMARAGYDPQGAVTLQEKFVKLFEGRKTGWLEGLFASHPPSRERVAANRKTAAALHTPDGILGKERYEQRIATLIRSRDGYRAYDEALAALQASDFDKAEALAKRALAVEPREALFHGLLGDIAFVRHKPEQAIRHYSDAIDRNREYFYFWLSRGLAYRTMRDNARARLDLARSLELLPTADAHEALGYIALESNEREAAVEHFRIAATSDSPAGQRARQALERLGVNPSPTPTGR